MKAFNEFWQIGGRQSISEHPDHDKGIFLLARALDPRPRAAYLLVLVLSKARRAVLENSELELRIYNRVREFANELCTQGCQQ